MFGVDIAVINHGGRQDRWDAFRKENAGALDGLASAVGAECERFATAASFDEAAVEGEAACGGSSGSRAGRAPPRAAASVSHRALWRRASVGSRPLVVLEDGALLAPDAATELPGALARLPGGWDLLLLGWDLDAPLTAACPGAGVRLEVAASPEPPEGGRWDPGGAAGCRALMGVVEARGLFAYVVSPAGARRLLEEVAAPSEHPLEARVAGLLPRLGAHVAMPPLALPPRRQAPAPQVAPEACDDCDEAASEVLRDCRPDLLVDAEADVVVEVPAWEAPEPPQQRWRVAGGVGLGVIVRDGVEMESPMLGRLRRGAVVKELRREGARILFVKLDGEGPERGWASARSAQGRELMEAIAEPVPGAHEAADERRWREDLARRRERDALRREQQQRDLEKRAKALEASGCENVVREEVLQECIASEERDHDAIKAKPERLRESRAPLAEQEGDVDLWASGDLDRAWWHEDGAAWIPMDGDEEEVDAEAPEAAAPGPDAAFFIPDNDPDEVVDLAEARHRGLEARRPRATFSAMLGTKSAPAGGER